MRKHFLIFFILIYLTQTLFSDEISGYQALFIKKTKLYSKIGNSHILIPLNLKIFEERIDSSVAKNGDMFGQGVMRANKFSDQKKEHQLKRLLHNSLFPTVMVAHL